MKHEIRVESGPKNRFDWFCSCGEFGFGFEFKPTALELAQIHASVANMHDKRLEAAGKCIHGGSQAHADTD